MEVLAYARVGATLRHEGQYFSLPIGEAGQQ